LTRGIKYNQQTKGCGMNDWHLYYSNRVNSTYQDYFCKKYKPFLDTIRKISTGNLLEAGCGIGSTTKALGGVGFDLYIHQLACKNGILAYKGDLLVHSSYRKVSVIHSHGVLEHFSDSDIFKIISIQKKFADYLVHYIPGQKYIKPSFGDERLMSVYFWRQFGEVSTFNNGYDYILTLKGE